MGYTPMCKAIKLDENGQPYLLPSGERLCCTRLDDHFPRYPHADRDDDGRLVEW